MSEETETTESGATQTFWYNDVSRALTFEEPDVASGGGMDQPVMPAMADVEARRWDVHQAILLHGGYKEVALALGWLPKRTSENRHLLQFSALAREMESFIAESGESLGLPKGRFPSEAMLLANDRDDLVQGVRWHGLCGRAPHGQTHPAASAMADAEEGARARAPSRFRSRRGAPRSGGGEVLRGKRRDREDQSPRSANTGTRGSASRDADGGETAASGRHDLRWRCASTTAAAGRRRRPGGSQPRGPGDEDVAEDAPGAPGARVARTRRPRLVSARRFRDWSKKGHRPWFIPADPARYYEERGAWVDWEDFLGTPRPPGNPQRVRAFKRYADAKRYMRRLRSERKQSLSPEAAPPDTSSAYKRWASSAPAAGHSARPGGDIRQEGEWVSYDFGGARRAHKRPQAESADALLMIT